MTGRFQRGAAGHRPRLAARGLLGLGLGALALLAADNPAGPAHASPPEPFLRFRERPLDYGGPAETATNLTELRIGWFGPGADATNRAAGDLWWAAQHAVAEANAAAGAPGTLPVRLVSRWAVDPWGTGVSQLARMIYDEQPLALLGSVDSATTHLAEQVAAKANLPLVSPIATDPSITLAGVAWMFACAPSDRAVAHALVDDLLAQPSADVERVALLTGTDHESRMLAREVVRELNRRQRPPAFQFTVPAGAANDRRPLEALAQAHADAVMILTPAADAARLIRLLRRPQAATDAPAPPRLIYGGPALARYEFQQLAGPDADGVRCPRLTQPNASDPQAAGFRSRFLAERGHEPDDPAWLTYDATRLLLAAIRQAGPNRAAIRSTLVALTPWSGSAGAIRFDGTGQNTRTNLLVARWQSGQLVNAAPSPLHATARTTP